MRARPAATAGLALLLATGCSQAGDEGPQPPTADEKRAVAEARAMIPDDELPAATASAAAHPPATENTQR